MAAMTTTKYLMYVNDRTRNKKIWERERERERDRQRDNFVLITNEKQEQYEKKRNINTKEHKNSSRE